MLGMTQVETAKHLNVSLGTYNQWESGKSYPSKKHIERACVFLDLKQEELPPKLETPFKK